MDYKDLIHNLENELKDITSSKELDLVRQKYIGTKGLVKEELKKLGSYPSEERKSRGMEINQINVKVEDMFLNKEKEILNAELSKRVDEEAEELDYKMPKLGHLHPITQTIRSINDIFIKMGYSVMTGPEIETDEFCLQRLNVPMDHPARDMQDMLYIEEPNLLLRSQTSSIEARVLEEYEPPLKIVIPGKVYRNEKVNKSNHFVFHQYQGVVVMERVSIKDLISTFEFLFKKMYGDDVLIRFRSKYYPEVEPGVGLDMQCFNCEGKGCKLCKFVGWIEMGGSGIIHPTVLSMAGVDTAKWMGFAFGLGLDRWVMSKYKITDIRSLMGGNIAYKYYENESTI